MPINPVGEGYLEKHPKLRKWVNTCLGCNNKGYKPEMPEELSGGAFILGRWRNDFAACLRAYFQPLPLDEHGLCEVCQQFNNPWKVQDRATQ